MMNKSEISYRPICESDFESLQILITDFAVFEKQAHKMTNTVEQMLEEKEYFQGIVALSGNRIVGYVSYFYAYYTWSGKSLYMEDLYVVPEYRGKGIGSELTKQLIELAKNTNCKRMRWQVSEWNKSARSFYESLGAEISGTEMNCDLYFQRK